LPCTSLYNNNERAFSSHLDVKLISMSIPLRLLLVEDSEDDAFLLERTLRRAGYDLTCQRVDTAPAMRAALECNTWDLIISDHAMPAFSAPAALSLAKQLCPNIPLIILSGEIDLNLAVSLIKDGAQDYIQKRELARLPAAIERLMQSVTEHRERERVNAALRVSEARFQTLVTSMDDIIFTLDLQGRHSGVFGRWLERENVPGEMFLGKTSREVFGDVDGAVHEAAFQHALHGDRVVYDWSISVADGQRRYLQTSLSPILDAGVVIGVVGVGRDLTVQKHAEVEDRRRQREFQTLVENAPDMIVRFDRNCRHIYANPAVEKELGIPIARLLGKSHRELGQPAEQAAWSEERIRQIFNTRSEVVFELEMPTPRGTQYYLCRGAPEFDDQGQVASALFIHRNITEQKRAAVDLEERIRFERLLSDLSTAFFQHSGPDIRELVEHSLQQVVEYLGMDRGSLHEISEDESAFQVTFSYAMPGKTPALPLLTASQFPWYIKTLINKQSIWFHHIEDAPPEASVEKEFCQWGGIHAVMVIPLLSGETVAGALSFIAFHPVHPHGEAILDRMRLVGEIFLTVVRNNQAVAERGRFYSARAVAEQERQTALADLQRSEQRYRTIFETMLNGFALHEIICDPSGRPINYRYLEANPAYEQLTGLKAREIIGKTVLDCLPGLERYWIELFGNVALTGKPAQFKHYVQKLNRHYEGVAYSPVHGQFAVVFTEITGRVNAEREIMEWKQRYELVTAASGQVVYDFNIGDGTLHWGGSVEQVLGYDLSEMNGGSTQWEALIDPHDIANVRHLLEKSERDGGPFLAEYGFRHKDGHYITMLDRGFVMPNPIGKNNRFIGIMQDVTESRRFESALRESEEKFRAFIEQNSEGVVLIDVDGRILEWNQAQARISGIPREEAIGKFNWDIQYQMTIPNHRTPERLAMYKNILLEELVKGECDVFTRPLEAVIARADGTYAHIQQTIFPIRVGDRFRVGSVTRDITERKRAEQEIKDLNAELEQRVRDRTLQLEAALKELEAFSYSVSHDLRAPLRHLDGFASILKEDYGKQMDEEALHYLDRIREASQHMGHLIEALLNLSRLSRGELRRGRVDLSQLAQNVFVDLQQREPQRMVDLSIQPGLEVQADETLMRAVLENLLGNAWKFTARIEHARIEFGCRAGASFGDSQSVSPVFFVHDNGAGFDMSEASRLFNPFQRLHNPQDFPGTGIGLATVQRVISRHGGRVWAESTVGEGATFYFTLA
jgi:PAS domain S-box-containing protein